MQLRDTCVLITGASTGIGRATALKLLEKGAHIYSLERTPMQEKIEGWTSFDVDITQSDQIAHAIAAIDEPIDIVMNNAGIMRRGQLFDSSETDFDDLMAVNVKGCWLVLKHALPKLRPDATIVQMCSRHALNLPVDPALYGLTKRIMMDMSDLIAKTYPDLQVKILCPGPVDTALARINVSEKAFKEKQKIMTTPEDIAEKTIALLESSTKSKLIFDTRTYTHLLE